MRENGSHAVSRLVLVLALALVITSGSAIYLVLNITGGTNTVGTSSSSVTSSATLTNSGANTFQSSTEYNGDNISIQALSLASSSSNLTATLNVWNSSAISRMSLFVNGTFVGAYNDTSGGWGYPCFRWMNSWSNGTSSYYFTATPYWMPMMSNWNWGYYGMMGGGMMGGTYHMSYMITLMAAFEDGTTANATGLIVPNQQGSGWGWWPGSTKSSSTTETTVSSSVKNFTIYVSYLGFNGTSGNLDLNAKQGETISIKFIWNDTNLNFDNAHQMEVQGYHVVSAVIDQQSPVSLIQFTAGKSGSFQINCIIPCNGMSNLQNGWLIVASG